LAGVPPLDQLNLPEGVEGLGVGAQLSADLRHVMVGTTRQHASSCRFGAGKGDLVAKPEDLALQGGHAVLEIIRRVRHGRDPTGWLLVAAAYCYLAEADGNRTRLTEILDHVGVEDRGGHQAPRRLHARS